MINNFKSIELFTTKRCNLNCKYCFVPKTPDEDMPFEIPKYIIDKSNKFLCIDFFGGEPTLRLPFIKEVVDYASNKNINFKLFTNGLIYNEDFKYLINNYPLTPITSFDGLIKTNIQRTDEKMSNKILNNILDMNKDVDNLLVNVVVNVNNFFDITENINFLMDQGLKHFNVIFDRTSNWESINYETIYNVYNDLIIWYTGNIDKINLISIDERFYKNSFSPKLTNNVNTKYMEKVITINYNGDIYPAELFINEPESKIGNILRNEFDNDKMMNMYNKLRFDKCVNCNVATKCWIVDRDIITCNNSLNDLYHNICVINQVMYTVNQLHLLPYKSKIQSRLGFYKKIKGIY